MRTLEREYADALLDARPVRPVPEVSDAPAEDDNDTTFSAFIGMLVGVAVSLPLWAALVVAVILILR
jgi:hypothetical protein